MLDWDLGRHTIRPGVHYDNAEQTSAAAQLMSQKSGAAARRKVIFAGLSRIRLF